MKEYNKLLLALNVASKVIIKLEGAEAIKTVKNVTKKNFEKLTNKHLLGQTRLGVTPEIPGQEDKVLFGVIDIDCFDMTHDEKYNLALSLQDKLLEDYRLKTIIETSKSKGFHVFLFFSIPQDEFSLKTYYKMLLTVSQTAKLPMVKLKFFQREIKAMPYSCHFLICLKMRTI